MYMSSPLTGSTAIEPWDSGAGSVPGDSRVQVLPLQAQVAAVKVGWAVPWEGRASTWRMSRREAGSNPTTKDPTALGALRLDRPAAVMGAFEPVGVAGAVAVEGAERPVPEGDAPAVAVGEGAVRGVAWAAGAQAVMARAPSTPSVQRP
jgi:hypothetical protein